MRRNFGLNHKVIFVQMCLYQHVSSSTVYYRPMNIWMHQWWTLWIDFKFSDIEMQFQTSKRKKETFMATKRIFTIYLQRVGSHGIRLLVDFVDFCTINQDWFEPIKSLNLFVVYFIDQFAPGTLMSPYQQWRRSWKQISNNKIVYQKSWKQTISND